MTTSADAPSAAGHARLRPDIRGLCALAIGLLLIYHAGVRQLPGGFVGVDVFFVISGFLVTGLLLREVERTGRLSLSRFYAGCVGRLLPAAGVALLVTAALTWSTAPPIERRVFGTDLISAALGVTNWRLGARSVDALSVSIDRSPVQHLWSLAVVEQFLVVWPLLLVAIGWWVGRRRHARPRAVLTLVIGTIVCLSFVSSLLLTQSHPTMAFLATTARLWEIGIGALVAVGATVWRRIPWRAARVLGWIGLATVVASALVLTSGDPWPGHHALAPTLGAAAVIVAGFASGTGGAARLLSWGPAVWIGGLSYSLYLWHWPLLVAATAVWGELGARRGLLVIAVSLVPAYLSHRFVERPIRFDPRVDRSHPLALSIGGVFTVAAVLTGLVLGLAVPVAAGRVVSTLQGAGGAVLDGGATVTSGGDGTVESLADVDWFVPSATSAPDDLPDAYAEGCQVGADSPDPVRCEYGDPESEVVVAVVGDSKILQWQSTLELIADTQGWRVVSYTKSSCGFHAAVQQLQGVGYTACTSWNIAVQDALATLAPDVVVTSQGEPLALADLDDPTSTTQEAMVDGLAASWTTLLEQDIEVVVIVDNPGPEFKVYECVAENPRDLAACTFGREQAVAASTAPTQLAAAERVPDVDLIDLRESICPFEDCVPVIGNVLLWRQGTHITDTYARSLTETLAEQLVPLVERAA